MPLDLSGPLKLAIEARVAEAKKMQNSKDLERAAVCYQGAAFLMRQYADETKFEDVRKGRLRTAERWATLAESLNGGEASPVVTPNPNIRANARARTKTSPTTAYTQSHVPATDQKSGSEETDVEAHVSQFITQVPVTWDQIGGLEETKREIKLAYGLEFVRKPKGINVRGWRKILLYGPPGTGKTLLAAATSNQIQATFYNVRLDTLLSKWFGESSKIAHALFESADSRAPSVIFVDELDAIAGKRGGEQSSADRRLVNTFLTELDGMEGKGGDSFVLVMAATNRPWDLDDAIISRFDKHVLVPLPDREARLSILSIHLDKTGFDYDTPLNELAAITEGYSGREIEQLVRGLVMRIVSEMNPDLAAHVDKGPQSLSNETLKVRSIKRRDWEEVLAHTPPKVTKEVIERLREWESSFE